MSDAPWKAHRAIAETIAQSFADAIATASTGHVDLSKATSCVPEDLLKGRPMPVRASVVRFADPLRDVAIIIGSHRGDHLAQFAEHGATAMLTAFDIVPGEAAFTVEETIEFDSYDEALEQCDALYLEASYDVALAMGEVCLVIGTDLLESVNVMINGESQPESEIAESSDAQPPGAPHPDVDVDAIVASVAAQAASTGQSVPSSIDEFDDMLALQEAAEAEAAQALAAQANEAAVAASASSEAAPMGSAHWASILSGVDVELSAELGRTDLTLGEITHLHGESVLTLDQAVDEPVTVYVNGTRYATARLVVVDGEYGVEILEVLEQPLSAPTLAA
jgi:flagellar motor switch protein FliN/FliY